MRPWTVYPGTKHTEPTVRVNDTGGDVLIVGGIHGDEPCGYRGIVDFYRAYRTELKRPVTFLIANPLACQRKVRYIDADLNRVFGRDADTPIEHHEEHIADYLRPIVSSFDLVVTLHSTQSTDEPFVIFGTPVRKNVLKVIDRLSVQKAVKIPSTKQRGSFLASPNVIEIECGYQKSERAVTNAVTFIREVVSFVGGLPVSTPQHQIEVFELEDAVEKPDEPLSLFVQNFTQVQSGEPLFKTSVTNEFVTAKRDFVPILMSENGYESILGYAGSYCGILQAGSFFESCTDSMLIEKILWD